MKRPPPSIILPESALMQPAQHVSITNSKKSPLTTRLNGGRPLTTESSSGGLPLRRTPPLPFTWCDIRCYKTPARSLGAVRLSGISLGAVRLGTMILGAMRIDLIRRLNFRCCYIRWCETPRGWSVSQNNAHGSLGQT
ncbi:hypothetical protein J6590_040741 [Homalodisca vitripennis]|nr:hypothetical protein J6590_040741 [Homalodisca vitripennis]